MDILYKIILILILMVILFFSYNYYQISNYKIENVKIKSNKINNDYKILHISDFHSNEYINLNKLLSDIDKLNSDYIFITGDMISRNEVSFNQTLEFLNLLIDKCENIYYVLGNHEMENSNVNKYIKIVEELGINILDDETIKREDLTISGLNFYHSNEEYNNLVKNLNSKTFNIILTHSPSRIPKVIQGKEDLILTGHTHGGQIRIPIIGALIAPGQGIFPKYEKGLYKIKNTNLYVNSGLGNSSISVRILNPVSMTIIELNKL